MDYLDEARFVSKFKGNTSDFESFKGLNVFSRRRNGYAAIVIGRKPGHQETKKCFLPIGFASHFRAIRL
jgi:hypothetical protein